MGHHNVDAGVAYRRLQQRLDHNVTGAPPSAALMKILRLLFTPDDARLAARLPTRPRPVARLAPRLGLSPEELDERVSEMAHRGLVIDLYANGSRHVALAPVVIGFFEFTFMRARDELPLTELARLFDEYMERDERFARSVFQGETQIGRSLVREEALPEGDHTEILDWERASHLVRSAKALGVSLCACRHKAQHLDRACDAPLELCLSLNGGAEMLVRNGFARPVDHDEGLRILEQAKEAGLAQTGDNVQRGVSYICNCCGCCCGMMQAIRHHGIKNAIVTSNWVMQLDPARCRGCAKCAEACPVGAFRMLRYRRQGKKRMRAVHDADLCLGCGVCYAQCKDGALSMRPRERRVFTPETLYDKYVAMAIERGKLAELVFDDPQRLDHVALGRVLGVLEKSPPARAALAIAPLRSVFLSGVVAAARRASPAV